MILIKIFKNFYVFLLLKLNSSDISSSTLSTISLPESYINKKNTPKSKTTEGKKTSTQINKNTKRNKIILGVVGVIIIGGIIYFIKSN